MLTAIKVGDIVRWDLGKGGVGVVTAYEPNHQQFSDIQHAWVKAMPSGNVFFIPIAPNMGEVVGHVDG